jgi:simple sugar transport system permease protein
MRLELHKRTDRATGAALLSPVIAIVLTLITAAILFAAMGKSPVEGILVYFVQPLGDAWSLQEIGVKATPLILIAVGLSFCYLANVWNIGAEGQLIVGALFGTWLALAVHGTNAGPWVLPAMLALGALGGALFALIPAILKVRFGASEILTSLMLVYVAELLLDFLVRGPWRDPQGFNFPVTVAFGPEAKMPLLFGDGRLHVGFVLALVAVAVSAIVLARTLKGFEIRLVGEAPRAARFAGFSDRQLTVLVFAISGALAGMAGIIEVAGPVGQLQPAFSPGYGFTAIIVAFLGRLNPIGILIAGLFLALTYIGGENAQISLRVPLDLTNVFQGVLLFYVLACDTLILYRLRLIPTARTA